MTINQSQRSGSSSAAEKAASRAGALAAIGSEDRGAQRRRVLTRLCLGDRASKHPATASHPRVAHQHDGQDEDHGRYQ